MRQIVDNRRKASRRSPPPGNAVDPFDAFLSKALGLTGGSCRMPDAQPVSRHAFRNRSSNERVGPLALPAGPEISRAL